MLVERDNAAQNPNYSGHWYSVRDAEEFKLYGRILNGSTDRSMVIDNDLQREGPEFVVTSEEGGELTTITDVGNQKAYALSRDDSGKWQVRTTDAPNIENIDEGESVRNANQFVSAADGAITFPVGELKVNVPAGSGDVAVSYEKDDLYHTVETVSLRTGHSIPNPVLRPSDEGQMPLRPGVVDSVSATGPKISGDHGTLDVSLTLRRTEGGSLELYAKGETEHARKYRLGNGELTVEKLVDGKWKAVHIQGSGAHQPTVRVPYWGRNAHGTAYNVEPGTYRATYHVGSGVRYTETDPPEGFTVTTEPLIVNAPLPPRAYR